MRCQATQCTILHGIPISTVISISLLPKMTFHFPIDSLIPQVINCGWNTTRSNFGTGNKYVSDILCISNQEQK
jgi:hypothetical protein